MNPLRTFAILACLAISAASASAQDHLEPEDRLLNGFDSHWEYVKTLRETLLKEAGTYYRARLICLPSFRPEWMVTVVREDRGKKANAKPSFYVEYGVAEKNLFAAKKPRDVAIKWLRVDLDSETADAVAEAWRKMLRGVRYPDEYRNGKDGTTYHFSRGVPYSDQPAALGGFEEGQIWSPEKGSPTSDLVSLGEALKAYTLAAPEGRDKARETLLEEAKRLNARLDRPRKPK